MTIYRRPLDSPSAPDQVRLHMPTGYAIVTDSVRQVVWMTTGGAVTVAGDAITRIDAGLTLDEAHTALTDGLTKAELVALGDDLGLTLSDSSLKAELLEAIRAHLEGLA